MVGGTAVQDLRVPEFGLLRRWCGKAFHEASRRKEADMHGFLCIPTVEELPGGEEPPLLPPQRPEHKVSALLQLPLHFAAAVVFLLLILHPLPSPS